MKPCLLSCRRPSSWRWQGPTLTLCVNRLVQGFFDVPVDNLYGRPLLKAYIQQNIPNFKEAVIISPDAGGAKRATAIADSMGMDFALIHKVTIISLFPCLVTS